MKKLFVIMLALFSLSLAAEEIKFYPLARLDNDTEINTCLWFRPDQGDAALPLKSRVFTTKDSVTGGAAMKCVFEKGAKGVVTYETDRIMDNDNDSFLILKKPVKAQSDGTIKLKEKEKKAALKPAGLTFYAKASKELTLKVGDSKVKVSKDWKKYDITMSDLSPAVSGGDNTANIMFEIAGGVTEKTWFILDRVGFEGPEFDKNPKIEKTTGPDATIKSTDIVYGAENLARTLANLKAKKKIKVVAYGDSVTFGAQAGRGSYIGGKGVDYLYFNQVARVLKNKFGADVTSYQRGVGGRTAMDGLMSLDKDPKDKEALDAVDKDDIVIIEFGANDMANGGQKPSQWKQNIVKLIAKFKKKSDQIVVVSPNGVGALPKLYKDVEKVMKEIAKEEKVACVDFTTMTYFRGPECASDLMANMYHPDLYGHVLMGNLICTIFTGDVLTYPEE